MRMCMAVASFNTMLWIARPSPQMAERMWAHLVFHLVSAWVSVQEWARAGGHVVEKSTKCCLLQLFLEAHFVYLYLVRSLELFFTLSHSPILFWFLTTLDSLYVYHMYTVFSHVTCLLSHAYDIHMLTNFTCLSLSHVYHFMTSIKYLL